MCTQNANSVRHQHVRRLFFAHKSLFMQNDGKEPTEEVIPVAEVCLEAIPVPVENGIVLNRTTKFRPRPGTRPKKA